MINLFNKTYDFIKMINLFSKTDDFIKMINLFRKTNDFVKMINLLSKTDLGRSGHVRFQTVGPSLHVLRSKFVFLRNF